MTNKLNSVLDIGMTNHFTRRVSEHQSSEIAGFTAAYRCHKLLFGEYYGHVYDAIAGEKQLNSCSRIKEDRANQGHESSVG